MPLEPPPFQEADRCDLCKCSFGTFRRRHHCRSCGRTLCNAHSSNQMPLPLYGILTPVRVCSDCFNESSRTNIVGAHASHDGDKSIVEEVSRLEIRSEPDLLMEPAIEALPVPTAVECDCGMPLCICKPADPPDAHVRLLPESSSTSTKPPNLKPKRIDSGSKNRVYSLNTRNSSVFNHGQTINTTDSYPVGDYEVNGEGAREAIKSGDASALKKLLNEGVDGNYCDKKGMSLLHLAALFNRTDIALILMESGASINCKNAQGETPLDCAPATLQYRMTQKVEEMNNRAAGIE